MRMSTYLIGWRWGIKWGNEWKALKKVPGIQLLCYRSVIVLGAVEVSGYEHGLKSEGIQVLALLSLDCGSLSESYNLPIPQFLTCINWARNHYLVQVPWGLKSQMQSAKCWVWVQYMLVAVILVDGSYYSCPQMLEVNRCWALTSIGPMHGPVGGWGVWRDHKSYSHLCVGPGWCTLS